MLDVRPRERGKVVLAFSILLLVVAAYTVVKAVRDAVFLSRFGVTEMSFVAIGLAVLAGVVVSVYHRWTRGLSRPRLIGITHSVVSASLLLLWLGLRVEQPHPLMAWLLYVWSSLFGVFIVMQFWLLASDLFDIREAKRLFALIGAGAISGGLVGGLCAQFLAGVVSAATLLPLAAAMLMLAAVLAQVVWPMRPHDAAPATRRAESHESTTITELLSKPSFVRAIAIGLLLSTMATTLLDWQLKAIAKDAFAGRADEMASFFGSLFAYQSAASLVFQIVVTGWLLRRQGVGVGRNVLPIALFLGALTILGHGALPFGLLAAAAGAKVAEGSLRFAIDKAVVELTWLPIPKELRDRSKGFVDTVVDRLGTGLTGALWLALAAFGLDSPDRVQWISIVVAALVIVGIYAQNATQHAYVDAFRQSLTRRTIDLEALRMSLGEAEAQRTLSTALGSEDADQVLIGLIMLADAEQLPDLAGPLAHKDAAVRLQALELLTKQRDDSQTKAAETLLEDADIQVREAAIGYLRTVAPGMATHASDSTSGGSDEPTPISSKDGAPPISYAFIALGDDTGKHSAQAQIAKALDGEDRLSMIPLLGAAPPDAAAELLRPLLDDDDPAVVIAAMQAAGRAKATALVDVFAKKLQHAHWRGRAASALADMGPEALVYLVDQLDHEDATSASKRSVVRLLGASKERNFAKPIAAQLDDRELRPTALRSLARLNAAVGARIDRERINALLAKETLMLYRQLLLLKRGGWVLARIADDDEDFFERAVREDINARVRRVFQMLSLLHNPADVRASFRGVSSPRGPVFAEGIEFLDNLLSPAQRERLLPTLEDMSHDQLAGMGRRLLDVAPESLQAALSRLLSGPDRWLRAVACWKIGHDRLAALRGDLDKLDDDDPSIMLVARRAQRRMDAPGEDSEPKMGLTLVEKALKLRAVDVLREAASEDLAYVAQIAEEREVEPEITLYEEGDEPDALYVVIDGEVDLAQGGDPLGTAGPGEAFGSWALVDESPRVASAKTKTRAVLLTVDREDFSDLLADRPDIVQAVFKAMVQRIRALAQLAKV